MKKFVILMVIVLTFVFGAFAVSAEGGPEVVRVIRVAERQLVIEFSEPVEIDGRNPFFGIRMVDAGNNMQFINGAPAQFYNWQMEFLDDKTMLLKTEEGVASQMIDFEGAYAQYNDYEIKFCIEELFPEGVTAYDDGTVYNIIGKDSGLRLVAAYGGPGAYNGSYYTIEEDYNYFGSANTATENTEEPSEDEEAPAEQDDSAFTATTEAPVSDKVVSVIHEEGNSTIQWVALGLAAVDFVGIIVILFVLFAKKKAK